MREATARASLFSSPDSVSSEPASASEHEEIREEEIGRSPAAGWNPDAFAREQIRGLVHRVFLSSSDRLIRQVVFSAVDAETDVRRICRRVGETLATETQGAVAVMGGRPLLLQHTDARVEESDNGTRRESIPPLRRIATRVRGNLWLVPAAGRNPATTASLHSYLGELRREFEYSIVEAPPAGESNETAAMAQFADGIILVLSAQRTRRVTAVKIKDALEMAQARLLGTVLSDRVFPIPEKIYRRL